MWNFNGSFLPLPLFLTISSISLPLPLSLSLPPPPLLLILLLPSPPPLPPPSSHSYEGTGRSLSLKLIEDLRKKSSVGGAGVGASGRLLREVKLEEPIRYAPSDPVEAWLHELLCLDASNVPRGSGGCPDPRQCNL